MKKNKIKKMGENINEKMKSYLAENGKLLEKYKMSMRLVINFPTKKSIPLLSKLAMKVVNLQGGILDIQFIDDKKT